MKKAVLIIAVLLLVSSFVFAQDAGVKIGAWGRGIFTVVQSSDLAGVEAGNLSSQAQPSWGKGGPRIGFTVSGNSANAGFQADVNVDNGLVGLGDQQKLWLKPIDILTVQLGVIQDNTLRGDGGAYGAWNWVRYGSMNGEDSIFQRVKANAELSIAPIEGLYAYAGFSGLLSGGETARRMLAQGQYGIGYTIPNVGVVRAQSFGQDKNTLEYTVFNAAFKLTAVQNLTVDLGGFFATDAALAGYTAKAAAQINYNLDVLKLMANANISIPQSGNMPMEFGVGAEYGLGDGLAVAGDIRYANAEMVNNPTFIGGELAGMVSISKGFSNGLVGIGVELTDTTFAGAPAQAPNSIAWLVPIRLEYWF